MPAPTGEARSVPRAGPIRREVPVPASKSLTNRALVLATLASGETCLRPGLRSGDTDALARALAALGADVVAAERGTRPGLERHDGFRIVGTGGILPAGRDVRVDLGDGGTPVRFMLAVAAFAPRRVTVDGSARMRQRPVADGVRLLRSIGVDVSWAEAEGRLPVTVDGRAGPPAGGSLEAGALASSQFVSALLLVAPWMERGLEVRFLEPPVSRSYVDLTVDELRRWGADVSESIDARGALRAVRVGPGPLAARGPWAVEPDASSALYWAAAGALVPGSDVALEGPRAGSRQPDARAIDALAAMGADLVRGPDDLRVRCRAPAGDLRPPVDGLEADLGACPDGALMLAAAAAAATGPSRLTGLGTLRAKESDRLAAMADGLARVGAGARHGDDWIEVDPIAPGHRVDAVIDPHGDHRVAMAFAVLGLRTGGIRIADPGCVAKSYPRFWECIDLVAGTDGQAHRSGLR